MPISTDSDKWEKGRYIDWLEIQITNFLDRDQAYTLQEIESHIYENQQHVFPNKLREDGEFAEWARLTYVSGRLEKLVWLGQVDVRNCDDELYYTLGEDARFPLAELEVDVPGSIRDVEKKVDSETKDLENRIRRLERKFNEEFGVY